MSTIKNNICIWEKPDNSLEFIPRSQVESSWNVMARGDVGRGSEGETGEWSG